MGDRCIICREHSLFLCCTQPGSGQSSLVLCLLQQQMTRNLSPRPPKPTYGALYKHTALKIISNRAEYEALLTAGSAGRGLCIPQSQVKLWGKVLSHLYAFLGAEVPLSLQQGSQGTHLHPLSCIFSAPCQILHVLFCKLCPSYS